ncbi:phosphate permease [Phanerochaete sordida]|uniref:Phosphate permease n=1 Tax=Phanerochaete sordida TaxID=48140 RepID=A0A9P3GFC1_9APHY|nr:phosphate permease [Phanerochaete sordida]
MDPQRGNPAVLHADAEYNPYVQYGIASPYAGPNAAADLPSIQAHAPPGIVSPPPEEYAELQHPAPRRHFLAPPPPAFEPPIDTTSDDGEHARLASASSARQYSEAYRRRHGASESTLHPGIELSSMAKAHSFEGHGPVEAHLAYGDTSPLSPNRYGMRSDDRHPERVLVTLTANMTMPYRDQNEPPNSRAGFILSKERQSALAEVDGAHFSWFHLKVCLIAGVGFFTDAYDIFAITLASVILDFVYSSSYDETTSTLTVFSNQSLSNAVKIAAPLGTLIGQLFFGRLADKTGRKRMYGIELIIIIIGTFGQALSAEGTVGTINIYACLIIWRFVMGLGIGGDYPLSAVIASEFASTHIRGKMMTAVFANQGWGQLGASLVGLLCLVGYTNAFPAAGTMADAKQDVDRVWRIMLGLGCIPASIALYFRLTIPETPRYTMDIERNVKQAVKDIETFLNTGKYTWDEDSIVIRVNAPKSSIKDFLRYFGRWENFKLLFACAYAWFAVDVAFYGVGLNTDTLFCSIGIAQSVIGCTLPSAADGMIHAGTNITMSGGHTLVSTVITPQNVFNDLRDLAAANLLFSGVGLVPGYWVTFLLIEHRWFGRKRIQLIGFAALALLFVVIGTVFPAATKHLGTTRPTSEPAGAHELFGAHAGTHVMLALFIFAAFFMNFGPNATTFMVPGELFPTRYRSTCHGLSAAAGKVGAILSQFAILGNGGLSIQKSPFVFIPFMVTGFLATLLLDETSQETLEDMSHEPQEHFISGLAAVQAA